MPDVIDRDGLQVKTLTELREEYIAALQGIYGSDINVDQNSPDGQQVDIQSQVAEDLREILLQINAGFDPDQAFGRVLDQRVSINGISRNGGTYTFQDIEITTDRALNLVGLDAEANELNPAISNLYTVKDDAGTLYYLLSSQTIPSAGTYTYTFRAAEIGKVEVQPNTITTPDTVIAGVTGINNPSSPNSVGEDEETDAELKIRRRTSVAISSQGFLDGLEAALNDLEGVTTAIVYENDTNATDSDGTPAHSIWAIVEGGAPADIGQAIYTKKTAGCGMRGAESVDVPRPDGRVYTVNYDTPGTEDLYIRFSLSLPNGGVIDNDDIKNKIVENILWDIGGDADAATITCYLRTLNENYIITGMGVGDDGISYGETISVASPQNRWLNDVSRITIT